MARAYSLDLRERVVAAVLRGLSCRSPSTAKTPGLFEGHSHHPGHAQQAQTQFTSHGASTVMKVTEPAPIHASCTIRAGM
jgi:hypothetical protein